VEFSVVIPTYKRPDDLLRCVNSILSQSLQPAEILIVDDDNLPEVLIDNIKVNCAVKNVELIYCKKDLHIERRGSSESRNKGLKLAKNDIVFVFDDDVELCQGFFEYTMKIWIASDGSNLLGVGGVIVNNRRKGILENIYNKIFLLDSSIPWDINDLGFQVWNDWVEDATKGYYAHGGVCSYNKRVVEEIGLFKTFDGGRTALEDVEFCLRAKRKGYYFVVEPKARVFHYQSKVSRESEEQSGYKEGYNRVLIYFMHCHKNYWSFLKFRWANFGWVLRQLLVGHYRKGKGIRRGTCAALKALLEEKHK